MYSCQLEESMKAILSSSMFHNTETQSNIYKTNPSVHKEKTETKDKRLGGQRRMSTREGETEDKRGITQNAVRQLRVSSHWGS